MVERKATRASEWSSWTLLVVGFTIGCVFMLACAVCFVLGVAVALVATHA